LSDSIAPQTPLVSIIDASTGRLVYEYTQMDKQVSTLVWSPDGHYIVSGEGNTDGSCVARVWTAE
jgi:WD40 repeat protein